MKTEYLPSQIIPSTNKKLNSVQVSNFLMTKAVSDAIRTSLGPHGMDKAIISNEEILITNDGATILKNSKFNHPAAKLLVEISKTQDSEVGDGTTSVIVLSGSFLGTSLNLLRKGVSFKNIMKSFEICLKKAKQSLIKISIPVNLTDKNSLYHTAYTALESKVLLSHSHIFAPLAVEAVLSITDIKYSSDVDLNNIKIIKKLGGTIEQSHLINGLGIDYPSIKSSGGPNKIINAKIAIIQFCINAPSTDTENILVVENYSSMDKILREEKQIIIAQCRKIKATGCNVILIQKSILKESVTNFALETLSKLKILIVKDVERNEISFISETLGCIPIVDIESFSEVKLGKADMVEEKNFCQEKIILFYGIRFSKNKANTIVLRGSNQLLLDEAERSFHDALCVIRSIIRRRFIVGGGGSVEMELSSILKNFSKTITGSNSYVMISFANSLEIIPYTLSENAGLDPIDVISRLRKFHLDGNKMIGINARKGIISNMLKENIVSPLLVFTSILNISVEFSLQLLKIDDILEC
jgi:T-complex protein 1 subunit delta